MATRRTPSQVTAGLAPLGAFGVGGVLHLYVGLGAGPIIAGTGIVAVAAIACAIARHLPELVRGGNERRIIRAVEEKKMTAEDAARILHADAHQPSEASKPTASAIPSPRP